MQRPDRNTPEPNSLRVLHVIHGYPPHYMAGSEVYTRSLVRALREHATLAVFCRVDDPFSPPYRVQDSTEDGVLVRRVNRPGREYTFEDKYLDAEIDAAFRRMCEEFAPDLVHFGHLSHLSTRLPVIAKDEFSLPTVFTVHDFWLLCYRGQLVDPALEPCPGPSEQRCLACARAQYRHWASADMVAARRRQIRKVLERIDLFLCPSRTTERFLLEHGVPRSRVRYSPYGLSRRGIRARRPRTPNGPVRFGFLGRVIPVKGVGVLLRAFRAVRGEARLEIHGNTGASTPYLEALRAGDERITFCGPYANDRVGEVLERLDVLVAPSLWPENAPLVIQEAQLAGLPVITCNTGGMAELVRDGVDGLLVPPRDETALTVAMQQLVDEPSRLARFRVEPQRVRSIEDDAASCLAHYRRLCSPRRLTIVTNPGLCNLSCPMCDTHSVLAKRSKKELAQHTMLSWELVERTVRELARLGLEEVIPSTMGEPLLWPEFHRLLALLEELGLQLNLTTNGTFPRGGVTRWAPLLLPVLSDIKVSLNAIEPAVNERVMCGVKTERQIANVEAFVAERDAFERRTGRRVSVTIQATFMETNLNALEGLLCWAIDAGIDRFKGHHLWVTWPALREESLRRNPEAAQRWNAVAQRLHEIAETRRGPNGSSIVLENIRPLDPETASGPPPDSECPFLGREAWIEADGSFQICCCPSNKRRAFGDFGNVHHTPLPRLWASNRYRRFIARWGNHPNCRECNMRRPKEDNGHAH